jgi:1,4-alpha-glucan branching enzyme
MAASQDHITTLTPMGATLTGGGATFRVWAPGARHVHVSLDGGGHVLASKEDGTYGRFHVAGW